MTSTEKFSARMSGERILVVQDAFGGLVPIGEAKSIADADQFAACLNALADELKSERETIDKINEILEGREC